MRRRVNVMLIVGLLGATLLTGCVVVPLGGWGYGGGGYYRREGGGGHYRYQSSPYRPYYPPDR
jgi:hypothetical protein